MLPYVRPPGGCKLDAFNNFLLFRLFCPSFLFGCCIFSRISAGFCQGEFSRTSARSLPGVSSVCLARGLCGRRGRECLPWLMSQGPVMLLGPIGFGGARVFRKVCSAATTRLAKTRIPISVQLFCDCGLPSVLCEVEMGRRASNLPFFRASSVFWRPAAIRNRKKVAILGVFLFLDSWIGLMPVLWAGCPGRSAFVDDFGQRCGRGQTWRRGAGDVPGVRRGRLDVPGNTMP